MNGKKLAKPAEPLYSCRMLFAQRATFRVGNRAGFHDHPFWQFEIVEKGRLRAAVGEQCWEVTGGALLLIPVHVAHSFTYQEDGTLTTSVKFRLEGPAPHDTPVRRGPSAAGSHMVHALLGLLPPGTHEAPHYPHVVDSLLTALIAYLLAPEQTSSSAMHLSPVERIRKAVLTREVWPVSVTELARDAGLSVSRASHLFHETYGTTLKSFVDQTRADLIGLHLRYSDISIKGIAATLGFDDIYSFSRFFKRLSGVSPRAFRDSCNTGSET